MQQLHFEIKVNDKRKILVFTQHLFQETKTGAALVIEHAPLAAAGIHQQAQGQGQIALLRKVADLLRAAVFVQQEVVLGKVADDLALLIADRGQQVHHLDAGRELGGIRLDRSGLAVSGLAGAGVLRVLLLPAQQPGGG